MIDVNWAVGYKKCGTWEVWEYTFLMERFEFPPQERRDRIVDIGNLIQLQLAERHGETIENFIEKHAKDFRDVLDAHPEIIEGFDHTTEEMLHRIETVLYH
jgi:hypothetical protein